ncbi:PREDICTED: uncharacterized protein LOC109472715 [Branchiostoma belcheri]|uniref:Uncharacterized protein LOC109472715 n=1 Tax=Branchiostoma belcheri TaxID=7741 RepID=A0A6P4YFW8_BRABE|nr:PREDICTED: uncharacterized protein LOC109472715 [Branchiostoma belcheri]
MAMALCEYCALPALDGCPLKRCGLCKDVFYCSKSHQELHWPEHKDLCRAARAIHLEMTEEIIQHLFQESTTECDIEDLSSTPVDIGEENKPPEGTTSDQLEDDALELEDVTHLFFGETNEEPELEDMTHLFFGETNKEPELEDMTHQFFGESNEEPQQEGARRRILGKIATERTSAESIHAILSADCCTKKCLRHFTYGEAEARRKAFWIDCSQSEARDYILTSFRMGDAGASHPKFHISGKAVCHKAWIKLNGISTSRYYSYLQQYKCGQIQNTEHGRQGNDYPTERSLCAQVWLEGLAAKDGDKMPNSEQILLPASWTMNDVYLFYQEENKDDPVKPLKRTQFFKVWRTQCKHIRIPKFSRFAKCTMCDNIKKALLEARNKKDREDVRNARSHHILLQKLQRMKYYKHSRKARRNPEQYMSVIIDGMDQEATLLPHYAQTTKDDHGLWRLKTQVTGALSHGERKCYARVDHMQYPHDTNLTLNFLTDILVQAAEEKEGHLPPVLYIQMDNKAGECKNRWILAYCCALVHLDIVKKVKVSYLMVGHTHEDIDQLFSKIQSLLRRKSATTMDALLQVIEESYTPKPKATTIHANSMFDIKDWLDQEMSDMDHHNLPHAFKVQKENGEVCMYYKMWSSDKSWSLPTPKPGVSHQAPLNHVPIGQPKLQKPNPYVHQRKLSATVKKLSDVSKLSAEETAWWASFIADISKPRAPEERGDWGLLQLGRHSNATHGDEDDMELLPLQFTINQMMEKHYQQPEVFIGSKASYLKRKMALERSAAKKKQKDGTQSEAPGTTAAAGKGRGTAAAGKGRGTAAAGKGRGTAAAGKGRGTAAAGKGRGRTTPAPGKGRGRGRTTGKN